MGIPSYYKKLVSSIPGLVSKSSYSDDKEIAWLWMDFNCLIYHCLYRDDILPYPGITGKTEWENHFLDNIIKYTMKVINKVNPTCGTRICIDGVVPMAKMRQQRLRRFKSSWLYKNGIGKDSKQIDLTPTKEVWDTNAITPGTEFMSKLKTRLDKISNSNKKIHISASDEPGEGEHKIMSDWRSGEYKGDFAVYGLDADLVVLSILNRELLGLNNKVFLFREEINAGKIERDSLGEEEFEWFSINLLRDHICSRVLDKEKQTEYIINYCFSMSILGNDFLPSSLGLKIRDDGHTELLEILDKLLDKSIQLINSDLTISSNGLLTLFRLLSVEEAERISHYIDKKLMQANGLGLLNSDFQLPIGDNNWPLNNIEELCLRYGRKKLVNNWELEYMKLFDGFEINKICNDYLYTIQWTWDYYTGKMEHVCYNWYYPYRLPPLWKHLCEYINNKGLEGSIRSVQIRASDISPLEQLSIVLPLSSWDLIPECKQRALPYLAPQYFPEDFGFDPIGKRFFWECEAEIPVINICEVKALFS